MGDEISHKAKGMLELCSLLGGENNEMDLKEMNGEDLVTDYLLRPSVERLAFVNKVGTFAFRKSRGTPLLTEGL